MSYVITGATGHLGRHVVETLLARGVEPAEIVATGRDQGRLADLAGLGVRTQASDNDDVDSLRGLIGRGDKVLLVSGPELGHRIGQHRNVIDAARASGAALLAYTSIAHADRLDILLAADHQATEKLLAGSGLAYALLRNDLYLDLYAGQLPVALAQGAVVGSAGEGRLSAALRAELAEAAAAVLLLEEGAGVYELGGDEAFSLAELAATFAQVGNRPIVYRDLPVAQYAQVLVGAGLPAPVAEILADAHRAIANDDLLVTSGDLSRLILRPTATMGEAVRATGRPAGESSRVRA